MITISLTPVHHQVTLESLKAYERTMRNDNLDLAADLVKQIINEISLDTLEDKSKGINEKDR